MQTNQVSSFPWHEEMGIRQPTFNEIAVAMSLAGIQPIPTQCDMDEIVGYSKISAVVYELDKGNYGEFEVEDDHEKPTT